MERADALVTPIGFADDINLLAYGQSTAQNCNSLQSSHDTCLEWARTYGMRFSPAKYTLTHFTRNRKHDLQASVTLAETTVQPKPSVRILGVILDSKLRWKAHEQAVKRKMTTQMLALKRTTASTWGATMLKARQIYQAVIRPVLAYRAPVWHQPGAKSSMTRKLHVEQNKGLRTVLGTFMATPIRKLETEAYIPPVDLWLNGRVARYQARIEWTGIAGIIQNACTVVQNKLQNRNPVRRQRRARNPLANPPGSGTPGHKRKEGTEKWIGGPVGQWRRKDKPLVQKE